MSLRALSEKMSSDSVSAAVVFVAEGEAVVVAADDNDGDMHEVQPIATSNRKRQKHRFLWEYVHDWHDEDSAKHCGKRQCTVCRKWYSGSTNAPGSKSHMKTTHDITGNDTTSSAPSGKVMVHSTLNNKPVFLEPVLQKYENAVMDYVVECGITLRAAGGAHIKKFVVLLTNGYERLSTRMILRRIAELYRILEPLLVTFLCNLNVAISLTLDE